MIRIGMSVPWVSRGVRAALAGALLATVMVEPLAAQQAGQAAAARPASAAVKGEEGGVRIVPIRDNIYVLVGAGGNVTVQIGADGVLLVDTGTAEASQEVLEKVKSLSDGAIRYVLNTSAGLDHVGGNAVIAASGQTIAGGNMTSAIGDSGAGAAVVAHENVLGAMSHQEPSPPFEAWPTSTFFTESKSMYFNGEGLQILHQPNAHSSGDSIVYFLKSDIISAGDVYTPGRYPYFDASNGGSLQGIIDSLNRILALTITENMQEGGTLVVPGHGRVGDESAVVEFRDMLTIIRSFIQEMIREGKSLQEIQKARPTFGYDPQYGTDTGPWTTEMFVEAVYRELTRPRRSNIS